MKVDLGSPDRDRAFRVEQLCNKIFIHTDEGKELLELLLERVALSSIAKFLGSVEYTMGYREGEADGIRSLYRSAVNFNPDIKKVDKYESGISDGK